MMADIHRTLEPKLSAKRLKCSEKEVKMQKMELESVQLDQESGQPRKGTIVCGVFVVSRRVPETNGKRRNCSSSV